MSPPAVVRLAYVTTYDARDVRQWSGTGHFMASALEAAGADVTLVGPLTERYGRILRVRQLAQNWLPNRRYVRDRDPVVLRGYAAQVEKALEGWHGDFVFSPGTIPVAQLGGSAPLAFWTDGTFGGMLNYYPHLRGVSRASVRAGMEAENAVLERCTIAIYTSQWAADTAVRLHGADPNKVKVVLLGANLPLNPEAERTAAVEARSRDRCELLFLGVDWERKGGPIAVAATHRLNQLGLPTRLTVVGCEPRLRGTGDHVDVIGRVDKGGEPGRARLRELLARSHFLILPTQADCTPVVFAEASAFALPSLTTDTGGVSAMVVDGANGHLLPPSADGDAFAQLVVGYFAEYEEYLRLCWSSLARYRAELNWDTAGRRVVALLREAMQQLP